MNNYPMQIMVDNDTAMMVQAFTDSGVSIDLDKLLKPMAENSEAIEDFIQEIETGDPRFMFPVTDSNMKRLIIEETNRYSVSPEKYLKAAIAILYADNIFGDGFEGGALMELVIICFVLVGMIAGASIKVQIVINLLKAVDK